MLPLGGLLAIMSSYSQWEQTQERTGGEARTGGW